MEPEWWVSGDEYVHEMEIKNECAELSKTLPV